MGSLAVDGLLFPDVTFVGPRVDDERLAEAGLPLPLARLLAQVNGWIALGGALHVRGVCDEPPWHGLAGAAALLTGPYELEDGDACFAQGPLGDQYVLRAGSVWRLEAEWGELRDLGVDLRGFLAAAIEDPDEWVDAGYARAHRMRPGQLLLAWPPFCVAESAGRTAIDALPAADVLAFHAQLAPQLRDVPDGGRISVTIER